LVSTVTKSWQAVSGIDADDHPEDGGRDQSQNVLASISLFREIIALENVKAFIRCESLISYINCI
jgi:hypothetical protein